MFFFCPVDLQAKLERKALVKAPVKRFKNVTTNRPRKEKEKFKRMAPFLDSGRVFYFEKKFWTILFRVFLLVWFGRPL